MTRPPQASTNHTGGAVLFLFYNSNLEVVPPPGGASRLLQLEDIFPMVFKADAVIKIQLFDKS